MAWAAFDQPQRVFWFSPSDGSWMIENDCKSKYFQWKQNTKSINYIFWNRHESVIIKARKIWYPGTGARKRLTWLDEKGWLAWLEGSPPRMRKFFKIIKNPKTPIFLESNCLRIIKKQVKVIFLTWTKIESCFLKMVYI